MRPKLWNGAHPIGEALVRGLEMTGAPYLSAHTADGCVAGVMEGKGEVKFTGGTNVFVIWYGSETVSIHTPPPYESFWVMDGVRSDSVFGTTLPNGYYLTATEQYLGALVMSGLDPVPNAYSWFVVDSGLNPGYYATETGLWFADLVWDGSGADYLRAVVFDVEKLRIAKRYEYIENLANPLRPVSLGWPVPQGTKIHIACTDTTQPKLYDLKALTQQTFEISHVFDLSVPANQVVAAKFMKGAWYVLTQTPTYGELFKFVGGVAVAQVTTQALYSWTLAAADGRIVVGGWDGDTSHILEVFDTALEPKGVRRLGEDAFFIDVTCNRTTVAALTWPDDPGTPQNHVIRSFSRADLENPLFPDSQPPTMLSAVGGRGPDGEVLTSGFYIPDSAQFAGRHLVVVYSGDFYSPAFGPQETGEVFIEVLSRDASKRRKTVPLDTPSTLTGFPFGGSAAISRM